MIQKHPEKSTNFPNKTIRKAVSAQKYSRIMILMRFFLVPWYFKCKTNDRRKFIQCSFFLFSFITSLEFAIYLCRITFVSTMFEFVKPDAFVSKQFNCLFVCFCRKEIFALGNYTRSNTLLIKYSAYSSLVLLCIDCKRKTKSNSRLCKGKIPSSLRCIKRIYGIDKQTLDVKCYFKEELCIFSLMVESQ